MPLVAAVVLVVLLAAVANSYASGSSSTGGLLGGILNVGRLDASQIRLLAESAGFTGDDLETAVAIALAESSGDPAAIGDVNAGVSVGLWQVNLRWHPEYTQAQLLDPQSNANAAYKIYSQAGMSFEPWSTYKNEAYLGHLDPNTGLAV